MSDISLITNCVLFVYIIIWPFRSFLLLLHVVRQLRGSIVFAQKPSKISLTEQDRELVQNNDGLPDDRLPALRG